MHRSHKIYRTGILSGLFLQPVAQRRWCVLLLVILSSEPGCVRRRLNIRSDPPGALVSVDQREIGTTPVSVGYTFYGTRNFQISRDGYESASVSRTFKAPWYQLPVIEFFTENLWPGELRDERYVDFQLVPQQPVATEKLVQRARDLRSSAQSGLVAPLPAPAHTQLGSPSFLPPPGGFAAPPPAIITPP